MPGMQGRMFAAIGIALLASMSQSAAQQAEPSSLFPAREELAGESSAEGDSEPEEEGPRSPFEDHIETDRDAFTPSTRTAPASRWIMESSYSFIDNRGLPDTNSFPELLFPYGLFKRVELRWGWNYEAGAGGSVVSGESGIVRPGEVLVQVVEFPLVLVRIPATARTELLDLCRVQPPGGSVDAGGGDLPIFVRGSIAPNLEVLLGVAARSFRILEGVNEAGPVHRHLSDPVYGLRLRSVALFSASPLS